MTHTLTHQDTSDMTSSCFPGDFAILRNGISQLSTSEYRQEFNTPCRTNTYSKARLLGFSNSAHGDLGEGGGEELRLQSREGQE